MNFHVKIGSKMSLHSLHRLHRKTLAASTCPRNVGVVEYKLCSELRLLEVHFRAEEGQLRLLVDEDLDAVLRHLLVHLVPLKSVVQDVAEAVASSRLHSNFETHLK